MGTRYFYLFTLTLALGCAPDSQGDCALADIHNPRENPGDLYRCRDALLNGGKGCGPDGYPVAFAAKYAEIYMWAVYPELSVEGQRFLDANLICLQSAFREDTAVEMTCEQVAQAGFAAHPACYLSSGICDLDFRDRLKIFSAIQAEDLGRPGQSQAFGEIASNCAQ